MPSRGVIKNQPGRDHYYVGCLGQTCILLPEWLISDHRLIMVSGYQPSTNVFEFCFLPPVGFTLFKEESFAESLRLFLSAGERCPCGAWVAPAFHIQTSKVDAMKPRHVATPNLHIATPLHSTLQVQATPPSANQQEAPPLSDTPVTAGGD